MAGDPRSYASVGIVCRGMTFKHNQRFCMITRTSIDFECKKMKEDQSAQQNLPRRDYQCPSCRPRDWAASSYSHGMGDVCLNDQQQFVSAGQASLGHRIFLPAATWTEAKGVLPLDFGINISR